MALTFNGNSPDSVVFNGNQCDYVYYNGTLVWQRLKYTAPTAKSGLVYNGAAQALVNAGVINAGAAYFQYSLDGANWQTSVPTGTNAGGYTVYWRVIMTNTGAVAASGTVGINISKATAVITPERAWGSASYTASYSGWRHSISCTYNGDGPISISISDDSIITGASWSNNELLFTTAKVYRACSSIMTITAPETNNFTAASATHGFAFV